MAYAHPTTGPVTRAIQAMHQEPEPARRGVLRGLLAGAAALPVVVVPAAVVSTAPHADAELVRLGRLLDEAWASERRVLESTRGRRDDAADEMRDAAYDLTGQIVREIEGAVATTLDGLKVKARAVSWCHDGEPFEPDSFDLKPATDMRIASTILRDLMAMGGAA